MSPDAAADVSDRLEACRTAAERGGRLALDSFRTDLTVETKADPMDAVTEVDRAVQREVIDYLDERYPDEPVVGEEEDALKEVPAEGPAWVVDPIDGTSNYVAGNRNWVTSVAFVRDGEGVVAVNAMPATGDTYAAGADGTTRDGDPATTSDRTDPASFLVHPIFGRSRTERRELVAAVETAMEEFGDARRVGAAQAALSGVACGELEAAVSTVTLNDWDTVAGVHLVRRAGGTVTDARGDRWTPGADGLLASNGEAHGRLVEAFDPADGA
ncbi:inositol monophosphatase family protein [Candidatus Halobonum tyrrellensis]|uniref:fructose-bisphosphatase n=1 Tax=Candidatus Halobonum tyrrellensis G22 TaxID=1324957 RepID=V4HIA2_9EURY|nr:inositol monophosphatase family protein [Candidatus Halobonum tyrrellensis]ESP87649.1 inositol monophosphatase [Candidatus Halobonum tyrrellensis G22]